MAKLDIAREALPQDGRIKIASTRTHTRRIDSRLLLPTLSGEKIVMRLP